MYLEASGFLDAGHRTPSRSYEFSCRFSIYASETETSQLASRPMIGALGFVRFAPLKRPKLPVAFRALEKMFVAGRVERLAAFG